MKYKNFLLIAATAALAIACNNGNTAKEGNKTDSTANAAVNDTTAKADAIAETPGDAEEVKETDLTKEPPSFSGSYKQTVFTADDESDTPRVLEIEYDARTKTASGQWIVPKGSGDEVWPQIAEMKGRCKNGVITMTGEGGMAEYELDVRYIDAKTISINGSKYCKNQTK